MAGTPQILGGTTGLIDETEATEMAKKGLAWILEEGHRYDLDLEAVDISALDIASTQWCVLGQAHPRHYNGAHWSIRQALGQGYVQTNSWMAERGFLVMMGSLSEWTQNVATVTDAWARVLAEHRELVGVNAV